MTESTLYVLITCCLEPGRKEILERVVDNLTSQAEFNELNSKLIVFDNASTVPGTVELLTPFANVFQSDRNIGYWTALRWVAHHYEQYVGKQRYIYSIESDCIHTKIERLADCEQLLEQRNDVSMVRTQEFIVAERHLYDKNRPRQGSRVYAWQSQTNRFRNEHVEFKQLDENLYLSNFTPVVCGLNRLPVFTDVLDQLAAMPKISEADFMGKVDAQFPFTAVYDGGLFHSQLSFANMDIVAGSRPNTHVPGYRSTQQDRIDPDGTYTITKVK